MGDATGSEETICLTQPKVVQQPIITKALQIADITGANPAEQSPDFSDVSFRSDFMLLSM
jgi:hypothetical protein